MSNSSSASSGGLGLFSVLLVIFVTLKLLEVQPVASWSWFWVLSPFWIPLATALALIIVYRAGKLGAEVFSAIGGWFGRRRKMRDLMDE